MKKIVVSAVVAAALSSVAMANDATKLEEAFKNGSFGGHVGAYGEYMKIKEVAAGESNKHGFSAGSVSISYETAPLNGFSLGAAAWGTTKFSDKNDVYDNKIESNAIFHKAYAKYNHNDAVTVIAGRQDVDLEWLTDYIEGIVGVITPAENLAIVAGWANRKATVDFDEVSKRFERMNGNKGVYVLDAKWSPISWLELNPYFYYASDVISAPGLKATASYEFSEDFKSTTMAQYVVAKVDNSLTDNEDGNVMQIQQNFDLFGAALTAGYIKTDKTGGAGYAADGFEGIASFGDQNPFEEGNHVYDVNAKSFYVAAAYEVGDLALGALYGQTKYSSDEVKEKELNLSIGYSFIKNLKTSLMYVNVKNDSDTESYNGVKALVAYNF
ncbi:MAG: Opr family porin [Wolinella sp.]